MRIIHFYPSGFKGISWLLSNALLCLLFLLLLINCSFFTPRCSFSPINSLRSSDTRYIFLVIWVYAVNYLLFEFPPGPQVSTINVISYNICSARTGLSLSKDCYFTLKSPKAQQLTALGASWEHCKPPCTTPLWPRECQEMTPFG